MDILSNFAERIKELMFERKITATNLATPLGVKPSTLYRYLKGERTPTFENFIKLVEHFDCSADFLLGVTEQSPSGLRYKSVPPFSTRFRFMLEHCKMSQYALHKKTNFSYDNFNKWLKGVSQPYADNLVRLALAFDCSVDFLIGRTDC